MGRRGPAPTPTAILNARGSWRAKQNPDEPKPDVGAPKCPRELSRESRKVWRGVSALIAPGVLTKDSVQTLSRYCHGLVRWWKLADWLENNPDTYETRDEAGNIRHVRHPNVGTYEKLGRDLLRIEQEFGLTPAARTRVIASNGQKPKDNKARFFGGPKLAV